MGVRSIGFSLVGLALLAASGLVAVPAHAALPSVKWDEDGMAWVEAPPFEFEFELENVTNPSQIRRGQVVRLSIGVVGDADLCETVLIARPTLNGEPNGDPVALVSDEWDFDEYVTVRFPVNTRGTYAVTIEGALSRPNPNCFSAPGASEPYSASIEMFTLAEDPPAPQSTKKLVITSSGPRTLVANTRGRAPSIRITYTIKDSEKRAGLLHSICMRDTDDCWFEDAKMTKKSYMRKTSTGWVRTWDYYWERVSPSTCVSYYWNQPDVSVLLVVSNADGKVIGRKKHTVKLTCR